MRFYKKLWHFFKPTYGKLALTALNVFCLVVVAKLIGPTGLGFFSGLLGLLLNPIIIAPAVFPNLSDTVFGVGALLFLSIDGYVIACVLVFFTKQGTKVQKNRQHKK